MGSIGF